MDLVPRPLLIVFVFAFGAIVGSFLNVVVYRVPRRRSIVRPGSSCPRCGAPIHWYDNIPILSWIVLRAHCRSCGAPISIRYPLVEAAAGLLAVLTFWRWGLNAAGLEAVLFAWISLALGLIDLEHKLLPDVMTLPSIVLGLALAFTGGIATPLESILGALVGGAIPAFIIVAYKALRGIEGMGWGDVKYLAAIGAVAGIEGCLWILIAGAILGALTGLALILAGKGGGKTELPFGTFLAAATLVWLYAPTWLPTSLFLVR